MCIFCASGFELLFLLIGATSFTEFDPEGCAGNEWIHFLVFYRLDSDNFPMDII